jgi:hypothetical protein
MSRISNDPDTTQSDSGSRAVYLIKVSDLVPHPLNAKIYGTPNWSANDTKQLLKSIEEHGILEPIVYARLSFDGENYANYVVSGHRRFAAAIKLGLRKIPGRDWGTDVGSCGPVELLFAEKLIIESNQQRMKSPEQKAHEYEEYKRIESESAKRLDADIKGRSSRSVAGTPRDKSPAHIAISGRTAEKLGKIVNAADQGNKTAKNAPGRIEEKKGANLQHLPASETGETDRFKIARKLKTQFETVYDNVDVLANADGFEILLKGITEHEAWQMINFLKSEQFSLSSEHESAQESAAPVLHTSLH